MAQMRGHHLGHTGIVIDANAQIGFGNDSSLLGEAVGEQQFTGIAKALDDLQMQIQAVRHPRHAAAGSRYHRQQAAHMDVVALVQLH